MILEEFITFIEGIGFKLDVNPLASCNFTTQYGKELLLRRFVEGNILSYSTLLDHSFEFSYNGYNIYLTNTRFSLDHNIIGVIDSPSRTNQRNFDLSDLELLEIHFKSEIRNMKLKELGI
jgi:hypothetical protein